jgi:hypothetical protein
MRPGYEIERGAAVSRHSSLAFSGQPVRNHEATNGYTVGLVEYTALPGRRARAFSSQRESSQLSRIVQRNSTARNH